MRKISYDPLWKKLIDAKMTKTELAKACGVSRTTIAKISKNESVCLDVILKICNVLECKVTDVLSILPEGGSDTSSRSQVK